MIELTVDKVVTLLHEAVADRGEFYVYQPQPDTGGHRSDCAYVHGTEMVLADESYEEVVTEVLTPGCIVGHALISAGVSPQLFLDLDLNRDTPAGTALKVLAEHGILRIEDIKVIGLLECAQTHQDNMVSWRSAVDTAVKEVSNGDAYKS